MRELAKGLVKPIMAFPLHHQWIRRTDDADKCRPRRSPEEMTRAELVNEGATHVLDAIIYGVLWYLICRLPDTD